MSLCSPSKGPMWIFCKPKATPPISNNNNKDDAPKTPEAEAKQSLPTVLTETGTRGLYWEATPDHEEVEIFRSPSVSSSDRRKLFPSISSIGDEEKEEEEASQGSTSSITPTPTASPEQQKGQEVEGVPTEELVQRVLAADVEPRRKRFPYGWAILATCLAPLTCVSVEVAYSVGMMASTPREFQSLWWKDMQAYYYDDIRSSDLAQFLVQSRYPVATEQIAIVDESGVHSRQVVSEEEEESVVLVTDTIIEEESGSAVSDEEPIASTSVAEAAENEESYKNVPLAATVDDAVVVDQEHAPDALPPTTGYPIGEELDKEEREHEESYINVPLAAAVEDAMVVDQEHAPDALPPTTGYPIGEEVVSSSDEEKNPSTEKLPTVESILSKYYETADRLKGYWVNPEMLG